MTKQAIDNYATEWYNVAPIENVRALMDAIEKTSELFQIGIVNAHFSREWPFTVSTGIMTAEWAVYIGC